MARLAHHLFISPASPKVQSLAGALPSRSLASPILQSLVGALLFAAVAEVNLLVTAARRATFFVGRVVAHRERPANLTAGTFITVGASRLSLPMTLRAKPCPPAAPGVPACATGEGCADYIECTALSDPTSCRAFDATNHRLPDTAPTAAGPVTAAVRTVAEDGGVLTVTVSADAATHDGRAEVTIIERSTELLGPFAARPFKTDDKACADITLFGAFPDDEKDDTGAIQQALDSCIHMGGAVCVPAGVYTIKLPLHPNVTDTCLVIPSDCTLRGEGAAVSTLQFDPQINVEGWWRMLGAQTVGSKGGKGDKGGTGSASNISIHDIGFHGNTNHTAYPCFIPGPRPGCEYCRRSPPTVLQLR